MFIVFQLQYIKQWYLSKLITTEKPNPREFSRAKTGKSARVTISEQSPDKFDTCVPTIVWHAPGKHLISACRRARQIDVWGSREWIGGRKDAEKPKKVGNCSLSRLRRLWTGISLSYSSATNERSRKNRNRLWQKLPPQNSPWVLPHGSVWTMFEVGLHVRFRCEWVTVVPEAEELCLILIEGRKSRSRGGKKRMDAGN